jgi:hypothetical protein
MLYNIRRPFVDFDHRIDDFEFEDIMVWRQGQDGQGGRAGYPWLKVRVMYSNPKKYDLLLVPFDHHPDTPTRITVPKEREPGPKDYTMSKTVSIEEPFQLSSYTSSYRGKQKSTGSEHVFVNSVSSRSKEGLVTVTAQADGVHLVDVCGIFLMLY